MYGVSCSILFGLLKDEFLVFSVSLLSVYDLKLALSLTLDSLTGDLTEATDFLFVKDLSTIGLERECFFSMIGVPFTEDVFTMVALKNGS